MAHQPERRRRSLEPDKDFVRQQFVLSGKNLPDFSAQCGCSVRTVRKMLAGIPVDRATLEKLATRLNVSPWFEVLSDAEKAALGLDAADVMREVPTSPQLESGAPSRTDAASLSHCFQLPAVLHDFTGRANQILDLASKLRGDGGKVRLSALRGMGGVGKTSLAVRVAHEVKDRFPDAQLFIALRGTADRVKDFPMTPSEAMARVIRAFHPDEADLPEDEEELAGIYRSVLTGKRALIVLDNAGSEAQIRTLLTAPPPAVFLITSRHAQALDDVADIQVGMLSSNEAYSLLRSIIPSKGSKEELSRMAVLCGHLPLGLRVAGDFLRLKEDWRVEQYLQALQRERLRWLKIGDDPSKDVEVVLKLSSAHLVRDSVTRATRWHLLHIFQGDFDLGAAAAAWNAGGDDLSVLSDLSDMANRSLIMYDPASRRYLLHDLMKPIAEGLFG